MTNEAKKRLLDVVSAKRLTIGVSVTLNSIDSYDVDLMRECVEPIDDAGEAKILYQINAIVRRTNLSVWFLPRIFGQSQ
jgi:hypothetical protein